MIVNLVASNIIPASYAAGTGAVRQEPDGTWTAWVVITADLGLYGRGTSEGAALGALEAKIKGIGLICTTGFAEAEATYRLRRDAEQKKEADAIREMVKEAFGVPNKDPLKGLPAGKTKTPSEN
jgi:hypothetical protein